VLCILFDIIIIILFANIIYLFFYSNDRFRPITLKAFQQKLKQAEDSATKFLLPGAHSGGPGEDGEEMPQWVVLFHRYFEMKKSQVSKSAQQEQARIQIRTMQNTILPPPEPLGAEDTATELRSEVSTGRTSNLPSVNSSVVAGGTLTLVPVSTSNNNNNERHVRRRVSNPASISNGSGAGRSFGDISSLMEMMNNNTKAMLRRPFAEVQRDYEAAMVSLDTARSQDDESRIMFYELAVRNLFKELQSMDA
jgi:hypothetical protein